MWCLEMTVDALVFMYYYDNQGCCGAKSPIIGTGVTACCLMRILCILVSLKQSWLR